MPPRRTRLEEGIWEDAYGLAATVKVGRVQREQRFPRGTDRAVLRSWRVQTRAELDDERGVRPVVTGTLRADGTKWIRRKEGQAAFKADRSHLAAWYPALGDRLRSALTQAHIETQLAAWRTADPPVAVRTIRHRCRVLRECYQALDGPKARTPLDDVRLPAVPAPQPAPVPLAVIQQVAATLKAAKPSRQWKKPERAAAEQVALRQHYARFLVRATTGQRPAQIMRAERADVDLKRRIWFVRPSKGGTAIPFPLNADAVRAWKAFTKVDAWGAFDTTQAAKVLRRHGWPAGVRPYDLRHTFAIDLLLSGADLGDIQGLLGHTQIQTTRTHYAPILTALLRKATSRRRLRLA